MSEFGYDLVSGLNFYCKQKNWVPGNVFVSDPVPGDAQTNTSSGRHTLYISTTNVTANISLEATLSSDPNAANWGQVTFSPITGDSNITTLQLTNEKSVKLYQVIGRYCWLRLRVENFTKGTINSVRIAF